LPQGFAAEGERGEGRRRTVVLDANILDKNLSVFL
jgi:hypothetical protein